MAVMKGGLIFLVVLCGCLVLLVPACQAGSVFSDEELDKKFGTYDVNADGTVTKAEFTEVRLKDYAEIPTFQRMSIGEKREPAEFTYQFLDKDKA